MDTEGHKPVIPRLLYIGDVPVRALTAGSAVLYRLFENLQPDRLLIAENRPGGKELPGSPLPGVTYIPYSRVDDRWLCTRLRDIYGSFCFWRAEHVPSSVEKKASSFGVNAVIGLGHGYGWWTAHLLAQRLQIPMHLVVHDDWRGTAAMHPRLKKAAEHRFGICYRKAKSRLLISPAMEQEYQRRYGCSGTVLYPIQSRHLINSPLTMRNHRSKNPFTFAYAGDAGTPWVQHMLADFANLLGPLKARLRIHYSLDLAVLKRAGWTTGNVEIVPFQPDPAELQRQLMEQADALYLPMSFAEDDRTNVSLCFPSKTADYTATGLPILAHAPEYSSISSWSLDGSALLVPEKSGPALAEAVKKLMNYAETYERFAKTSLLAGRRDFSPSSVLNTFFSKLQN